MKNYRPITRILSLVCVGLILVGAPASLLAKSGGHLIVNRVANFGERIFLSLRVDGKEVARLGEGQNYDGYVSAGQHTISADVVPNTQAIPIWQKSMTIKNGQTYSFTAMWRAQNVVLVRN